MLLFRNTGCSSQEGKVTPSLKRGHHPYGPREICCSSTEESVQEHLCLRRGVKQFCLSQKHVCTRAVRCMIGLRMPFRFMSNCSHQLTLPSPLWKNIHIFCQPPFDPKEISTHAYHYMGEIRSSAMKKKKAERKSRQKENTSVGCKMTKRKANESLGTGPAIAEKYNLELGIGSTFAAKQMSQAVPMTVCLLFYRSQLKKGVRFLQTFFQFWPRDCKVKGLLHLYEDSAWSSYEKLQQSNSNLLMYL